MEPAREFTPSAVGAAHSSANARFDAAIRRPESVVLQVDATVSTIDGLAWLVGQRDEATRSRLDALHREAVADHWSWSELSRGRLAVLRPRRAEIIELGSAYLEALAPGVIDAAARLRRAGVALSLASDVAADALFGVAHALGVAPSALRAPRLRFDALGAYVGCELPAEQEDDSALARHESSGTLFVGTRRPVMFASLDSHAFVAFSGVVAVEGSAQAEATLESFAELITLLLR